MSASSIVIEPYNPLWPRVFEEEKTLLIQALGSGILGSVEHVGSTAVEGLSAKPIIDIMVGIKSLEVAKPFIPLLTRSGYCFYPYKADVMHWFCKPSPELRTHHLHLVPYQSELWQERITFRDVLRKNERVRLEYQQLKHDLAKEFPNDREEYTQRKWPFIQRVLNSKNQQ